MRSARKFLHEQGVKGFHELRAAYACDRYEQLTGHAAPVHGGECYHVDREMDRMAREKISRELGKLRTSCTSAVNGRPGYAEKPDFQQLIIG